MAGRCHVALLSLFLLFCAVTVIKSSHFRGAIITWDALDEPNQVEISWRISWRRSSSSCSQSNIDSQQVLGGEGSLQCNGGCAGRISPMSFICTDFSVEEDWTTGVNSIVYTAPTEVFGVRFSGNAWISLVVGGGRWSLPASVNITQRSDTGKPNSSPRSAITPIVRLQHGCNHTIVIPTNDPDGDTVRCRWASGSEECGGVCNAFPNVHLEESTCTINYEAVHRTGWYGVALMIEDFTNPLSTTPLSKIPLQFLVIVFTNEGPCSSAPEFIVPTPKIGACIGIPPNSTLSDRLIAQTGDADVSISAIETVSPIGFSKSAVGQVEGVSRQYYVNVSWTPQLSQYGENIFCFTAEDNFGLSSDQQCITYVAGAAAPEIVLDSIDPPTGSEILSSHTTWRMKFDSEFVRPSKPTFIRFYTSGGVNIYSINVASRSDVLYLSSLDRSVEFSSEGLNLQEKQTYYIMLESGIAKGLEFCGPESPAVRDTSFWFFKIKDTTPPVLQFVDRPSISNDQIVITWGYNEPSNSSCTIQAPDQSNEVVDCKLSWTGTNLTEGSYAIYISGTDEAGNVASPKIHPWRVDLTKPIVTISSHPLSPTNTRSATFGFKCNEGSCTYECSLVKEDEPALYTQCNSRSFSRSSLDDSTFYEFQIRATDQVGNIGDPVVYKWYIDTTPPEILSVDSVTLQCGQDFTPTTTGTPFVTDSYDSNPSLMYRDNPSDGCVLERVWTAMDGAGNTVSVTQTLIFTNPQPPVLKIPASILIPCGDPIEDPRSAQQFVVDGDLFHPCNRSMNVSYQDSVEQKLCGNTFTRHWSVIDDCEKSVGFQQTIKILELQTPDHPQDGQVNINLNDMLNWPQYPGSVEYRLYVWLQSDPSRPTVPTLTTTSLTYQPSTLYTPNTRYLWQVEYVLDSETNSLLNVTVVPSPIWGFETRTFADFATTAITVPSEAFSGQDLTVSWTVENIGSRGSTVSSWYDIIYLSLKPNLDNNVRRVISKRQSLFLDPNDGYTSSATIRLQQNTIGLYYVFIQTDRYYSIDDYDRSNNIKRSEVPVDVRLTPPPDLVVSDVAVPETSYSGEEIEVIFTVRNNGNGITAASLWYDAIFWSADNITSSDDTRLANVLHTNGLPPNAEYTVRHTVTVPRRIFGNFWIVIVTDIWNAVYEHVSEDNNDVISEVPINVLISPPPDLAITSFEVPTQAESATSIKLHWTVENIGFTETYETYWNDRVVLTSSTGDQSLETATLAYSGRLGVLDSYDRSVDFLIPSEYPNGLYNLTLYVDFYGHVFEYTYTSNNVQTQQVRITQLLPDLVVEFANASVTLDTAREESLLNLFWRVRNIGDGKPDRRNWIDRAYLSASQVFSTGSNIILGDVTYQTDEIDTGGFPSGSFYAAAAKFNLAKTVSGQMYVHIQADYRDKVLEKNADVTNNLRSVFIDIPSRSSNLKVVSVEILVDAIPSRELYSGQEVVLRMNVSNTGNWATDMDEWLDSIRISKFDFIDNSARLLSSVEHDGKLYAAEKYSSNIDLTLPDDLWGDLFILVKVDDRDVLYQSHDGSQKVLALSVTLEVPPFPELKVDNLEYSITTSTSTRRKRQVDNTGSRFLTVSWGVFNAGNSMVRYLTWRDAIVISKISGIVSPPTGILLQEFPVTGKLRTGQSYNFQRRTVIIPDSVAGGSFYVYAIPDYYTDLLLSGSHLQPRPLFQLEDPLDIPERFRPDLEAIYIRGVQAEVFSGQYVKLVFSGRNIGGNTRVNSWIDAIYMDSFVQMDVEKPSPNAFLVHQAHHIGSIGVAEEYQAEVQFQIPYSISGLFAIFIHIDYLHSVEDSDVDNNFARVPLVTEVLTAPLPDFEVSIPDGFKVRSGEPFLLKINISNTGDAPVNQTFYNVIYLSDDVDVDSFDTKILNTALFLELEVNTTQEIESEIFMPFDIPSAVYYVIVHVDSRNDVYEINNENNMAYAIATIEEAYSTDVAVISVTPPPSPVSYNADITIQWTLRNNGSENAIGYKCDTTYFSEDNQWSIEDEDIGTLCSRVDLRPFNNDANNDRSYSLMTSVPLLTPKGYRTIVRTRSNIRDLNVVNNIGVAQSVTDITIDLLELDNPLDVTLSLNEQKVFRIPNVIAEETLVFRLASDTDTDFNELYARYDVIASTGEYDVASTEFLSANQNAAIAKSKAGDYYVLIRKSGTSSLAEPSSYKSTITLTAKYARLEVLEVLPKQAAPLGTVTLRISGTLFPEESTVSLIGEDMQTVNAIDVFHFTSLQMYATFNISRFKVGSKLALRISDIYDDTMQTIFPDALTLIDGRPGSVSFRFDNPGRLFPAAVGRITLYVQNVGDSDILTPMLKLDLDGDATFQIVESSKSSNWTKSYDIYSTPDEGPGGILPPGGTSRIVFDIRPDFFTTRRVNFRITELPPSDKVENPYTNTMNLFKPYEINSKSWERVWSNFMKATGSSQATLSARLSKMANQLSLIGRRIVSMNDMIQFQTKLAEGFLSGNVLNRRTDLDLGTNDPGLHAAEVVRIFSPRLGHRNYVGSFGRGWSSPYLDMKLRKVTIGYAVLERGPDTLVFPVVGFNRFELPVVGRIEVHEAEILFIDSETSAKSYYHFDKSTYHLKSITNEFDQSTLTFDYDGNTSKIRSITSSHGPSLNFDYNSRQLIEVVSVSGTETEIRNARYTYDSNMEYLMSVESGDSTVQYTYTSDGSLKSVTQSDDITINYMYDIDGLLAGSLIHNPIAKQEREISFQHDGSGKILSTEFPSNDTILYIFDENGNVGYVKTLGTLSQRFVRNYQDGTKTTFIGDQVLSEESYDVTTDTMTIIDANGASNVLGLQPNGDINYIRDGSGNKRIASYKQDLLANITFADGSKEEYFYDDNGSLTSFKSRAGDMITYEVDENGNVVKKDVQGSEPTYFLYDHRGFVVEATNGIGKMMIDYTESGLPMMVTYPNGRILAYEYDESSRRIGLHDNMGYNISYVYDVDGNLVNVRDNSKSVQVLDVEFDTLGRISKRNTGNGCSTAYEYDTRGKKVKSMKTACSNTGGILDVEYGFDSRNRINAMNTTFANWRYRYDAASQVTAWIEPNGKEVQITYDDARNRRVLSDGDTELAYTVNDLNQYETLGNDVEFEHDLNGNLVEVLNQAEGEAERYVFSADNQLEGFANSEQDCSFSYDALGNLYQKTCAGKTTTYLVDPFGYFGADVVAEINGDDETVYYIHASYHGLVAMKPSNNTDIFYYHFDNLGSVLGISNDQQIIQNKYQYDPFGNVIASDEKVPNAYQYVGQWGVRKVDESKSLYFMRARFYDSRHGRFLTLDPFGVGGKSINIYNYANNNPLENIDPKGTLVPWLVGAGVGGVANTLGYFAGQLASGQPIKLGDAVGAFVGGAVGGALALTPLRLLPAPLVGAATSGISNIVSQAINNKGSVDISEVLQNALVGGVVGKHQLKPVLYGSDSALYNAVQQAVSKNTLKDLAKPGLSLLLNGIRSGAIGTTAGNLYNAVKEGTEYALPIIEEAFKNGIEYTKDRLGDFNDIANDLINDAGNFANELGDTISDTTGNILDRAGQEIDNIANEIGNGATDISNTLEDAFDSIQDTIGEATDSIGSSLQDGFQDASNSLGTAADEVKNTLQNTLDDLASSASNGYDDIKDSIGDAYDDIKDSLGSGAGELGDIASDALGDLLDANSFDDAKNTINDAIDDTSRVVDKTVDRIKDSAGDALNDIKDSVSGTLDEFKDSLSNAASELKDTLTETTKDLSDITSDTWDKIKDTAGDAFDKIKDEASGAIDDISDTIDNTVDKIGDGLTDAVGDIGEIVDDATERIGDAWDDLLDDIGDATDAVGDLWDGIVEDAKNGASNIWDGLLNWFRSIDPNDIIGPAGFGDARFIPVDIVLSYKIRFENDVNATAPAQRVFIITNLDDNLDIRTLRLGSYGFGNFTQSVDNPTGYLQETLGLVESIGVYVKVRAGLDILTRQVTWELLAIDSETGRQPTDPLVGFLPPNPENGTDGQGYVTFSVKAKRGTPDLSVIDAEARIIFDQNDPIDTPPIFNTIDAGLPTVNMTIVEETLPSGILAVQLQPYDSASGVRKVDIFQKTALGNSIVEEGVVDTIVTLDLPMGMMYNLIAVPTDNVGNQPQITAALSNGAVEAYFPVIEFSCNMVNNCSGFGTCTGENLCDCSAGRYGDACDTDIAPVEPPIIGFRPTNASEDSSVAIAVSVRTADTNPDSKTVVHIRNVPQGATLNHGELVGEDWFVPLESLSELFLIPPPNFNGPINLLLIATTTGPTGNATREIPLTLALRAVADPVTFDIEPTCYNSDMTSFQLKINLISSDFDGSENVSLIISNVPENVSITPADSLGDGQYLIHGEDIQFIDIKPSMVSFSSFSLSVTVRSIETSNGDMWERTEKVDIEQCMTDETNDASIRLYVIIAVCCVLVVILLLIIVTVYCLQGKNKEMADNQETSHPDPVEDKDTFDNPTYVRAGTSSAQPESRLEMSAAIDSGGNQDEPEPTDTFF